MGSSQQLSLAAGPGLGSAFPRHEVMHLSHTDVKPIHILPIQDNLLTPRLSPGRNGVSPTPGGGGGVVVGVVVVGVGVVVVGVVGVVGIVPLPSENTLSLLSGMDASPGQSVGRPN